MKTKENAVCSFKLRKTMSEIRKSQCISNYHKKHFVYYPIWMENKALTPRYRFTEEFFVVFAKGFLILILGKYEEKHTHTMENPSKMLKAIYFSFSVFIVAA